MKKEIINKLVKMSDQNLMLLMSKVFENRSIQSNEELERLILVEHKGNFNSKQGGFSGKNNQLPVFIGIPLEYSNKNSDDYNRITKCSNCNIDVKGYEGILKCPYCYHLVEFK